MVSVKMSGLTSIDVERTSSRNRIVAIVEIPRKSAFRRLGKAKG